MEIDISKLKDGDRVTLRHDYDPKELNLEQYDLRYLALLNLNGNLERVKDSLFFKGVLTALFEILCTRCSKPVAVSAREPFDLYYAYKNEDCLETTNDIREVMLLSYPVKFLCCDSCKGLCPRCGINLNEESCRCRIQPEPPEPENRPFNKLKDWYKKHRQ